MFEIKITGVHRKLDKQILMVDIDKEFKDWFKSSFSLKKWSTSKFRKVFLEALFEKGIVFVNPEIKVQTLEKHL